MKLPDLIATGWLEIRSHKMRNLLSIFAIAIGIATFFYTLSLLSQRYRDIDRTAAISGKGRLDSEVRRPISMEQYQKLFKELPPGSSLSLQTDDTFRDASYKGQELAGFSLVGVLPSFQDSAFVYQLEGRFFNWNDIENRHRVAVIPVYPREKEQRLASYMHDEDKEKIQLEDFLKRVNLLDQEIIIDGQSFTVIGLLRVPTAEKDFRSAKDQEKAQHIFIPYTTWHDLQKPWDLAPTYLRIVAGNAAKAHKAKAVLTQFLHAQFGPNFQFGITSFDNQLHFERQRAWHTLRTMIFIGLIAMIAGGIGIMNITMVVVFSRTREIGIRRALGATRLDILFQFLAEALLLGLCGAILGMGLGYVALLYMADNVDQMTFSWWVIAISISLALATSFLFALYPAYQASKLKPVDALKYE